MNDVLLFSVSSYSPQTTSYVTPQLNAKQFQYAGQHSPIPDYNHLMEYHPIHLLQDSDFPSHMSYWSGGGGIGNGGASPHHHGHYPPVAPGYSSRRASNSIMGGYSSNGYGAYGNFYSEKVRMDPRRKANMIILSSCRWAFTVRWTF